MRRRHRVATMGRVLGALAAATGLLALLAPRPAAAFTVMSAHLDGASIVGTTGDPNASGFVTLAVDFERGRVCPGWISLDVEATLAEIRQAPAGAVGDPVVALPVDSTCSAEGTDAAVLHAIVDDPASFYIQVATDAFPDGAIRGQLRNEDIVTLGVFHHACPPAIQTAAMIDGPEDCASALGRSDLPPTPGGLPYDPQPILFDVSLTLTDAAGNTFTGSAQPREPFCTATSCTIGNVGYGFDDGEHGGYNLAGPTLLQADSSSDGYRLGAVWALDHLGADGDLPLPLEVDLDARRITFDSTGAGNVQVRLFYFAAPDATGGPAATEGPAATVPPTTTASISPDPDEVALAAVLVVAVIAFASLLAAIRTLPRRR